MYPYFVYLLYVAAVIGLCVLLLRRSGYRLQTEQRPPEVEEIALLRGGYGAVVEMVIFKLYMQKMVELKANEIKHKLRIVVSNEQRARLSQLEAASIQAVSGLQENWSMLGELRRQLHIPIKDIEDAMKKTGWWKTPARWHWLLSGVAPCLVAVGSLKFINHYDGFEKWVLGLTVPFLAVVSRRIVRREMGGPTRQGKTLLKKMQAENAESHDPLRQVALFGVSAIENLEEYHLFCFMTRRIPYTYL